MKFKYIYQNIKDGSYLIEYFTIEEIENMTEDYILWRKGYYRLVKRCLFSQCKDKNKIDIYENDILKNDDVLIYVVFEDGLFQTRYLYEKDYKYENDSVVDNGLLCNFNCLILDYGKIEVIGNKIIGLK
jgi:hypothetical protein